MSYTVPDVSYNIYAINTNPRVAKIALVMTPTVGSTCKVSYDYKITIEVTPNNCSLSQFDIRATGSDASWDIDQGKLLNRITNLSKNSSRSCEFLINRENFPTAGDYRIGLYARNALDDSWDVTYLFFTLAEQSGTEQFILADGTPFEVITTRNTQD